MFGIKKDLSDDLQKLAESQKRTHESLRDLDETMAPKTSELAPRLKEFTDRCCMLAGKKFAHIITTQTKHSASLNEIIDRLDKIEHIYTSAALEGSKDNKASNNRPEKEDLLEAIQVRTDEIFQKLQSNEECLVYSYLVERQAKAIIELDLGRIQTLPIAQLIALVNMCDRVLTAMEMCE